MVEFIERNGNILDSDAEVICHQVNCQGAMGSGVTKAISDKWENVKIKYNHACCNWKGYEAKDLLGKIQPVKVENNKWVVNLFSQLNYGYDGKRYTSYDAVYDCLEKVAKFCKDNNIKKVAFPYFMSCCRGGAKWDIIITMIHSVFFDAFKDKDIVVEIVKL